MAESKRTTPRKQEDSASQDPLAALRDNLHAAESLLAGTDIRSDTAEGPLRKLLRVTERLTATHDVEKVLKLAASQIIEVFEAERVFLIDITPPDRLRFRFAASFDGETVSHPESEVSLAVVREAAQRRMPVLVADATKDRRFANVSSVRNLQLHSVMAAPLMAMGDLKGVVYADNRRLAGVFGERSLDLLGLFGNHIGVALHNAQLFSALNAARAELAAAERMKAIGQVAAFVAHEIKNPLASLYLLVGMLREHWDEERTRTRFFEVVPGELERLNRTVTDILGYTRPTSLTRLPIQLKPLAESALRLLEPRLAEQSVRVTTEFEEIPNVSADGERLREVFVNLIGNAIDAMMDGPRRELRLILRRKDEEKIQAIVEDSGPGIPQADLTSVFEPFHTRKQFGTGMGLAYCQKLAREHGGAMSAENIPNGGARFTLTLPVYGS